MYIRPFEAQEDTQTLTVATASTTTAITANPRGTRTLRLINSGSSVIFFKLGKDNTVTATVAASTPMLPNTVETFLIHNDITYIAYIGASAGNTLYLTVGEGE